MTLPTYHRNPTDSLLCPRVVDGSRHGHGKKRGHLRELAGRRGPAGLGVVVALELLRHGGHVVGGGVVGGGWALVGVVAAGVGPRVAVVGGRVVGCLGFEVVGGGGGGGPRLGVEEHLRGAKERAAHGLGERRGADDVVPGRHHGRRLVLERERRGREEVEEREVEVRAHARALRGHRRHVRVERGLRRGGSGRHGPPERRGLQQHALGRGPRADECRGRRVEVRRLRWLRGPAEVGGGRGVEVRRVEQDRARGGRRGGGLGLELALHHVSLRLDLGLGLGLGGVV
mmetsp:Transcript_22673/g.56312  ORF Transcript_22673/g.56312 Transcript_22673/m.56312 type:complete len:286 (-) Transcript_22673:534-1391(-)